MCRTRHYSIDNLTWQGSYSSTNAHQTSKATDASVNFLLKHFRRLLLYLTIDAEALEAASHLRPFRRNGPSFNGPRIVKNGGISGCYCTISIHL